MAQKTPLTYYRHREEILNVITHLIGFLLSLAGLTLLVVFAAKHGTVWHIVSFSIFGVSASVLYLASTLYHAAKNKKIRSRLNILDHSAIYLLIAGTYTPFCLVTLRGPMGWVVFGLTWGLAIAGIILKIFYTGRYNKLSTISYVALGWIVVIAIKPLIENLETGALMYLLAGGISYTIGAIFYMRKDMSFNHAIFHLFVLGGTICHFITIFFYLV